ncbi:MAG: hypothetical protein FWD80_03395 [Propionibacteriaceae bacterium]|nr:hypothetical protein [Propionibacteriaceae bacterium]
MLKLRDQRGVSMSVFACGAIMTLLIVAGLLVDGAAQVSAHERVGAAAAQVARFAMDASAPYLVDGQDGRTTALTAARTAAANYTDITFGIEMDETGALRISTKTTVRTIFLQLIGINSLTASGRATAVIYQP